MENEVIVIVSPQQWLNPLSGNAKDYAFEFSNKNHVIYINLPLDIISLWRRGKSPEDLVRRTNLWDDKIESPKTNLWVAYPGTVLLSINKIKNRSIYKFFNRINNYLLAKSIKRICGKLDLKYTLLFNDNLMTKGRYLPAMLRPKYSIYYLRDNFENHSYYNNNNLLDQRELIALSSFALANSNYLYKKLLPYNKNSHDVGQGMRIPSVDVKYFEAEQFIQTPVVGYLGNLTTLRLDLELIESIVNELPHCSFLFVGPMDNDFKGSDLNTYPNVVFTGPCEPEMVGSFIKKFDVAINPQALNDLTIGNYPRKIDEYLSYGKPVVTTYTEAMEMFKDYVYLATNAKEYSKAISTALKENSSELMTQRINFASQHTWSKSTEKIYEIIQAHKNGRRLP